MKYSIALLSAALFITACNHPVKNKSIAAIDEKAKKSEKINIDTSDILLKMSIRRIGLIMEAQSAEIKVGNAKQQYYLDHKESSYKEAKKAVSEYDAAFNRYDSLDKAFDNLYAIYYKKEAPQPTIYAK